MYNKVRNVQKDFQSSRRYQRKVRKGSRTDIKNRPIRRKLLTFFLFGRFLTIFVVIVLQFLFLLLIGRWLNPYIHYFYGGMTALSVLFLIYLVNLHTKPEFKLVWMIPVTIAPVFGILLYLFFKLNFGGIGLRKQLDRTTGLLKSNLKTEPEVQDALYRSPHIKDIAYYLQSAGGFPAYMDSCAAYFPSGEDNFADMLQELQSAKKFIFIEYFIIGLGYMWNTILDILIKKADEGVEVRVMYDGIGSMMLIPSGYPEYLGTLGIKAKTYAPLVPVLSTHQNNRDHRKIFVIDGRVAYTGGINLEDEYINKKDRFGYWKDTGIKIEGSAVKNFTAMFLQIWNLNEKKDDLWEQYLAASSGPSVQNPVSENRRFPLCTGGFIIPYGDDALNKEDIAESVYCDILNRARWYVHITTPYIILDNELESALIFAAKRGVEVSLLVPARADHYITFCIGRTYIKTLIENDVHVYEYLPGFIHAKMFVSDGERAVVGSINLDYRSLYHHFECAAFVYENPVVRDIERDFKLTRDECREITPELYKKIPVHQRVIGRVARMFAPLL
jgi:cardiolipin synthase